jgi:DsbC/DsbD-like thiol-disulfide interchange protein
MKKHSLIALGFVLALCAGAVRSQPGDAAAKVTAEPVEKITVKTGQRAPLQLTFHVKPGFHINSHQPSEPELIPTEVKFFPPEDLLVAKIQYPAGVLTSFPFDPSTKLSVYSGDVIIKGTVMPQSNATPGTYTVHAELRYQACDNNSCYPPKKLPVQFDVTIPKPAVSHRAHPNAQSPHIHN